MAAPTDIADWLGKDVFVETDHRLGQLADIYYDIETGEPAFLAVRTGALSPNLVLVAARHLITVPDYVALPWTRAEVAGAPTTQPGQELTPTDAVLVFRHFGLDYPLPAATADPAAPAPRDGNKA